MVEVCKGLHPTAYPTVHKPVGAHDVRVKLTAERSVHATAMQVLSLTSFECDVPPSLKLKVVMKPFTAR